MGKETLNAAEDQFDAFAKAVEVQEALFDMIHVNALAAGVAQVHWHRHEVSKVIEQAFEPHIADLTRKLRLAEEALTTFDEAVRNGSIGPDAETQRNRAIKHAHRKGLKALSAIRNDQDGGGNGQAA